MDFKWIPNVSEDRLLEIWWSGIRNEMQIHFHWRFHSASLRPARSATRMMEVVHVRRWNFAGCQSLEFHYLVRYTISNDRVMVDDHYGDGRNIG